MNKKLIYLTYQSFPSFKANTLQTLENLNYLAEYFDIELIFPLREMESTDSVEKLKKFYDIKESIKIKGMKHKYPFGKVKVFESILFIFSQYFWSKKVVKNLNYSDDFLYFTRSDWVFYFLSKKNKRVVFECHQLSRIRKYVMNKCVKYNNSKIIFLNKYLMIDSGIDLNQHGQQLRVIHNGVDSKLFKKNIIKDKNKIIFVGNLERFGESRNLEFYISAFKNKNMPQNFYLTIIGHPDKEVVKLKKFIELHELQDRVKVKKRLKRDLAIDQIQKSYIGLLINTDSNLHSVKYTSPLKYFEYMYSGLQVVASNFIAHRELPFAKNIHFFENGNEESFINSIKIASKSVEAPKDLKSITLEKRAMEIVNFIS